MAKGTIRIKSGMYKTTDVSGMVFPLVKPFEMGTRGIGFVGVRNMGQVEGGPNVMRVTVSSPFDYEFVEDNAPAMIPEPAAPVSTESDAEIMERIRSRFEILDEITQAAIDGNIRAAIVSGPPGVGKSFGVERIVEKNLLGDMISGQRLRCEVIKGAATPIGLYQTLYKFSDANCMVVFDDCDSILLDDVSLNLLKGALDSGKKRKISWLSESRVLKDEGIPNSFEFKGSVIFITNLKFDKMKSQKLRDHLDALQSRCHYLDLTLDTMRDKVLRIKQIADDGELFAEYDFEKIAQDEIIDFLNENKFQLREMSLRMAIKIADLRKSFPLKWKAVAAITCMRPA